jgi:phospholipid/cholesterol/gamma-HCH transport system substrate-binding protein
MEYRAHEVKAGFFIVVSLIVLFAFLFAITGIDLWSEKVNYRARFHYVGGIEVGSKVRLGGMDVGKVVGLTFPDDGDSRIELLLEVKEKTPIRRDSKATLTTIGLMGAMYVEISIGSPTSELLLPGSYIHSEDVTAFAQMADPISEISDKLSDLLGSINDLFNAENRENLSATLANLNRLTEQNADNMNTVMTNMGRVTDQLNETLDHINGILARSDTALTENMIALKEVLDNTNGLLVNMDQTMRDFDATILTNRDDYQDIMQNMNALTQNIEEFSQIIKQQPWSLIRKNAPPERKIP